MSATGSTISDDLVVSAIDLLFGTHRRLQQLLARHPTEAQ